MGYSISEVRMDDSQVVGEEQNVHGREILAREVRNNETQAVLLTDTCLVPT